MSNESRLRSARPGMWAVVVLGVSGALLAAGCGGSSTSASPKPPASPHPATSQPAAQSPASPRASVKVNCKDIDKLRTSLTSLTTTRISPSSAATLTTDIKNIESELKPLKGQAGGAFAGQANSLMASIDQIKKASTMLNTNPTAAVRQLRTSLVGLKAKAGPIVAEMNMVCPK
ncbi:MAG TPA: hypothetical protein VFQ44_28405 [Streptosporangiaceae bacterium]|nr:hypothetical protein [Streptosporangiaceae bacterium]